MPEPRKQKKQAIIIRQGIKPFYVGQVVELTKEELFALSQEADQNRLEFVGEYSHIIKKMKEEIEELKAEIKVLKGED